MANSFKDRWLPLIVFPTLLAISARLLFWNLEASGLAEDIRLQCNPGTGSPTPYLLPYTSSPGFNSFTCGFVAFFHGLMNDPLAAQYFFYVICASSLFIILPSIEASRMRRSALIAFPTLWLLLSQVLTLGVTFAIYWLIFTLTNNSIPKTRENKKITQAHAEAIVFGFTIGVIVPTFAMLYLNDPQVTAVWQIYPVFVAVAGTTHLLIRTPSRFPESGYTTVQVLLLMAFMISSSIHIGVVWPMVKDLPHLKSLFIPSIQAVDPSARFGLKLLQFLQWDYLLGTASGMAATLWFARSTRQLVAIIAWYAVGSPVIGPSAALAAIALWRESDLH